MYSTVQPHPSHLAAPPDVPLLEPLGVGDSLVAPGAVDHPGGHGHLPSLPSLPPHQVLETLLVFHSYGNILCRKGEVSDCRIFTKNNSLWWLLVQYCERPPSL